jgi:hypothetical protein
VDSFRTRVRFPPPPPNKKRSSHIGVTFFYLCDDVAGIEAERALTKCQKSGQGWPRQRAEGSLRREGQEVLNVVGDLLPPPPNKKGSPPKRAALSNWSDDVALRSPDRRLGSDPWGTGDLHRPAARPAAHRPAGRFPARRAQHVPAGDGGGAVRAHLDSSLDLLYAMPVLR